MTRNRTPQEDFWAGEFGTEYFRRIENDEESWLLQSNRSMFGKIVSRVLQEDPGMSHIVELGCSAGLNLRAIREDFPMMAVSGIEINAAAVAEARSRGLDVVEGSLLDIDKLPRGDLAFTKGVMIHLAPSDHVAGIEALYHSADRWILMAEYYSQNPREMAYRGHSERLFLRDWGSMAMDRFADLALVDYGFFYRRDPVAPQDDLTWFLFRKSND